MEGISARAHSRSCHLTIIIALIDPPGTGKTMPAERSATIVLLMTLPDSPWAELRVFGQTRISGADISNERQL
jgi:hypothetical protein